MVDGRLEGDTTIADLATALRPFAGRRVLDRTGLAGFYRVTMTFDSAALVRGPATGVAPPTGGPSLFTAIQEDLALRLKPSREPVATIVIDHIERPTVN